MRCQCIENDTILFGEIGEGRSVATAKNLFHNHNACKTKGTHTQPYKLFYISNWCVIIEVLLIKYDQTPQLPKHDKYHAEDCKLIQRNGCQPCAFPLEIVFVLFEARNSGTITLDDNDPLLLQVHIPGPPPGM